MKELIMEKSWFIEAIHTPILATIIKSKGFTPLVTPENKGKQFLKIELYDIKKGRKFFEAMDEINDYIINI